MSGTYTALWVYVLATIVGGIAAVLLHKYVVAAAIAPTTEHGDPNPAPGTATSPPRRTEPANELAGGQFHPHRPHGFPTRAPGGP